MSYLLNTDEILQTIRMIDQQHLDVRTITLGLSLLDCAGEDIDLVSTKIYDKICREARDLVTVGEAIEREFGIPIINKRLSVTPVALVTGGCKGDPVKAALAMDAAAAEVGVNFIGGFSALVHKDYTHGDRRLIAAIPEALASTERVCASVNVGSTRSGINMDAVAQMGHIIKNTAALTADRDGLGCSKLVIFCNAVEDNPFMAGAFHGVGEGEKAVNVGVSGPGVVYEALRECGGASFDTVAATSPAWASWWPGRPAGGWTCPSASWTCPWRPPRRWATPWPPYWRRWAWRSAAPTARRRRWPCSTTP